MPQLLLNPLNRTGRNLLGIDEDEFLNRLTKPLSAGRGFSLQPKDFRGPLGAITFGAVNPTTIHNSLSLGLRQKRSTTGTILTQKLSRQDRFVLGKIKDPRHQRSFIADAAAEAGRKLAKRS